MFLTETHSVNISLATVAIDEHFGGGAVLFNHGLTSVMSGECVCVGLAIMGGVCERGTCDWLSGLYRFLTCKVLTLLIITL